MPDQPNDRQPDLQGDDVAIDMADIGGLDADGGIAGPDSEPLWLGFDEDIVDQRGGFPWAAATVVVTSLAWTGLVLWVSTSRFSVAIELEAIPSIVSAIAAPVALLMLIWLLLERGSDRSVRRHLRLLAQMRTEHQLLAERLASLDHYWSGAQATLTARAATYSAHALDAGRQIEESSLAFEARMQSALSHAVTINEQGDAARRHMDGLAISLPKVDDVAKRAVETLREAGQTAYQFGGQLEAQIAAIRTEAEDSKRSLADSDRQLAAQISMLVAATQAAESSADAAGTRFAELLTQHRDAALAMLADLAGGMDSSVSTIEQRVDAARAAIDAAMTRQLADLALAISDAETRAGTLSAVLNNAIDTSGALDARLTAMVDEAGLRVQAMEGAASGHLAALDLAVRDLREAFDALGEDAQSSTAKAAGLGEKAAQILGTVRDATQQIDDALPAAITRLKATLADAVQVVATLTPLVDANEQGAAAALNRLREAEAVLEQQVATLSALDQTAHHSLAAQSDALHALQQAVEQLSTRMATISGNETPAMLATLAEAEQLAAGAAERTRAAIADVAATTGNTLEKAVAKAIDDATGGPVATRLARITELADSAVAATTYASGRLAEQLAALEDSSAALEARADAIATTVEKNDRDTMARQLSLLTESLQSTAVDLTRVLSVEVADQSWASYLKGDRGIFARRAVRLLSASEARDILSRYQSDDDFRALVNRYIHDFETMLRSLMTSRDGSSLSVTLLSSDIGKVYVALAQSIERLRG